MDGHVEEESWGKAQVTLAAKESWARVGSTDEVFFGESWERRYDDDSWLRIFFSVGLDENKYWWSLVGAVLDTTVWSCTWRDCW